MVNVVLVRPQDEMGKDYLDMEAIGRFMSIKLRTLGYGEASIHTRTKDSISLRTAPYCSVKTVEDGQKLLSALISKFPNHSFVLSSKEFAEAEDIVWHYQ